MQITPYPWHQAQWRDILARKAVLPHALLLRGREGTGKSVFARALALAVLCETPLADASACGICESCRWFAADMHPDFRELQPEALQQNETEDTGTPERKPSQQITIDQVRGLHDFINLAAHRSSGKVVLIHPAETLNVNAANALLKSLEEPPVGTRFILMSHRPYHLPATIISRCQQIALAAPSPAAAEQWLREQGVTDPELSMAQTGNAPLAALALNEDAFWTERRSLLDALAVSRLDALALAEKFSGMPLPRLLGWLQRWTYDLLSVKTIGRVRYNPDFKSKLTQIAAALNTADIARYLRGLVAQQRSVHHPLNPRLFVEQLLLSYARLLSGEMPMRNSAP